MENFVWFGHASFMFQDATGIKIYYIDPFELPQDNPPVGALDRGDIIFITHAHHDHLSPQDISSILKKDTIVVATLDSLNTLKITQEKFPVEPNKEYEIKGFKFQTVPAYNTHPARLQFHPKSNNWVGYIFDINGKKFYHAGDTDLIPEMKDFSELEIDYALLPMGGTYTMDVDEMIQAANAIKAKYVVPMHYKTILGERSVEAEEKLKAGVKNSEVLILKEIKEVVQL